MAFDHTFYLAGNPNSGKTSLFNSITGLRHHTGNYPGVTVERLEGSKTFKDRKLRFIDLPGSYNLTSYSIEERVARDALLEDPPDAVINVVDATNLERNLYLALSLMEMGVNVVIALNMSDLAKRNGIIIDTRMLEENLKVPVVETVAIKGEGVEELLEKAIESTSRIGPPLKVNYGKVIERELELVEEYLEGHEEKLRGNVRWTAVKLIEGDENVTEKVIESLGDEDFAQALEDARNRIESMFSDTVEVVMAERRYGVISGVSHPAIKYTVDARHTFSDQIDMVLTNRFAGIPIFLIMMYLVFYATFKVGEYPMLWLESFFGWLSASIASSWSEATMPLLRSLLIDGIIGGVGGVLVFLPNIIILFFAIALLEDSGYMARAAFLTDRFMRAMGLPGKSFIPILVGFGCTVPAVLATRSLDNERDRLVTILVLPLVSCGARLPVFALLIPAFFPTDWRGTILLGVYLFGILLAVVVAKILRTTTFSGEDTPFIMELPPYRAPTLRALSVHCWDRSKEYLKKAGTFILIISVLIWALGNFPTPSEEDTRGMSENQQAAYELEYSALGRIGRTIEPVTAPIGFDWKLNTALLGATAAKEVFVAQTAIVFSLGEQDEESLTLRKKLSDNYTPLTGIALILFLLIATPCGATVAVVARESGSWKWAILQWVGLTVMGYLFALAAFQLGGLFY